MAEFEQKQHGRLGNRCVIEQKQHGRLGNRCVIDLPSTDQEPVSCKQCYHSRWPGKLVNSVDDGRNDCMCHFRLFACMQR